MKAAGLKDNFRIVVYPRSMGDFGGTVLSDHMLYRNTPTDQKRRENDMQDRAEQIVKEIQRHVSDVASMSVRCDQEHVCSHCGAAWTEASNEYNGGCCEADESAQLERDRSAA